MIQIMTALDYPVWLRVDHWLKVLFLKFLLRSVIEILSTRPKLYWREDSKPGTEWARLVTKKNADRQALRDKQTGLDCGTGRSRTSDLIGTLRAAYHVVLQRNKGHPDCYLT
jgi:hypothetical protein